MLNWLTRRRSPKRIARSLYGRIVAQSRLPVFYDVVGVPDRLEQRFELLVLHLFLTLERLRREGAAARDVAQYLVEMFIADMDTTMRELGVGDMAVPKKVRAVAGAFQARLQAYGAAAARGDRRALEAAIARHVFANEESDGAAKVADYAVRALTAPGPQAPRLAAGAQLHFPAVATSGRRPAGIPAR